MNSIYWQPKALRQLRKIDAPDNARIRQAINDELVDLAKARNVKALTNHIHQFRLRVGTYRVFFNFDGAVHIVSIEEVIKRNERTY